MTSDNTDDIETNKDNTVYEKNNINVCGEVQRAGFVMAKQPSTELLSKLVSSKYKYFSVNWRPRSEKRLWNGFRTILIDETFTYCLFLCV